MSEIKAIIFDADNTLYKVNKERAYREMFLELQKETGSKAEEIEKEWVKNTKNIQSSPEGKSLNHRRERTIIAVLQNLGVPEMKREAISTQALATFWRCIVEDIGFDGDEKEVMARLKEKYTLAVASDEFLPHLKAKLNHIFGDWRKYFDFLVSAEDAGEHKPSENYAKIALKKLKMKPEEVIVVGDSWVRDLEQPRKLGIKTVLVAEKKEGNPDYFVKRLSELPMLRF